eukprot:403341908
MAFRSQLTLSRQLLKDKKIDKKIEMYQSAILQSIASMQRVQSHPLIDDLVTDQNEMKQIQNNIVVHSEKLMKQYQTLIQTKHKEFDKSRKIYTDITKKLDQKVVQQGLQKIYGEKKYEDMSHEELKILMNYEMFNKMKKELENEIQEDIDLIKDNAPDLFQ